MPWKRQSSWSSPTRRVPPPSDMDVAVELVMFHAQGGQITRCQPGYAAPITGSGIDPEAPKPAERSPPGAGAAARPVAHLTPSEAAALDILRRLLAAGPVPMAEWREACRDDGGISPGAKPDSRAQIANRSIHALKVKGAVEIVEGFARPSDLRAANSHTASE